MFHISRYKNEDRNAGDPLDLGGQLCSEEKLRLAMMRECSRVDRSGGHFTVAVFESTQGARPEVLESLAHAICGRLRFTDTAGWLNATTIGVLLPDTPHKGGRIYAKMILAKLPVEHLQPEWHVYTYPPHSADPDSDAFFKNELAVKTPTWKRAMDITMAGILLVILSPLMLLAALGIKLCSPGPVLFRQDRVGMAERNFCCYKFRSMHLNVDHEIHKSHLSYLMKTDVPMYKLDKTKDPRIFPFGRFIRAASIDELPQLFNVLKGDMSLIGPRPAIPYEHQQFQPWQRHRIDTLPGLTGLWQVSGKNKTTFSQMMRYDNRYAHHIALRNDIQIISKTIPVIVGQLLDSHLPILQQVPEHEV